LFGTIAGIDRVLDAMSDVIAQNFLFDPAQSRPNGSDLRYDINTIAVFLDHAGKATDLTLDAVKPLEAG
jgi:hypothetical protein